MMNSKIFIWKRREELNPTGTKERLKKLPAGGVRGLCTQIDKLLTPA